MKGVYTNPRFFLAMTVMLAMAAALVQAQATRVGFYARTCPRAESIVRSAVQSHFRSNPNIAPGLLRMHFHDCFVQGCDASILIDGPNTEKTAPPNRLLRGYEVIDDAKTQLEAACPGVVSCADILTLAARDSVFLTRGINWAVPTGRRDGRVSLASDTTILPGFRESIDSQKQKFAAFGLNTQDLVALVGGHTIGTSACQLFSYRLYNFTNGGPDPTINPAFVPQLQALCPQNGDGSRRIDLDTGSGNRFDTSFFANLRNGRGILESDQKLWTDPSTRTFVQRFLGERGSLPLNFNVEFARSMVKMSNIGFTITMKGAYTNPRFFLVMTVMLAMAAALVQAQGTRVGSTVQSHFRSNPTIAPGLLRMHFHDCFVQGCDASILIDGPNTEKTAPPNIMLRGYELEAAGPGVVSCADILTLAARDSVFLVNILLYFLNHILLKVLSINATADYVFHTVEAQILGQPQNPIPIAHLNPNPPT
ncbi:hypothetical protein CXB51_007247 [Gossypium anomalum]|uniref:peroxidase n=1 Tax=Gossypium anomalum TaxID=47600 RepID=A0A8J5ZEF9_9ROSI|nr:hypothetical protein CXB51_007247 [Gossypium anomalum]